MPPLPPVTLAPSWGQLVFHVLAHVRPVPEVPSSLYDERYVRAAEAELGPAEQRQLGRDLVDLSRVASDHARYARMQALAFLFDEVDRAQASAQAELHSLSEHEVARSQLLPLLMRDEAWVELLRCAALLEARHYARLDPVVLERAALERCLVERLQVAPRLSSLRVRCLPALGLRGRAVAAEVWIGVPAGSRSVGPTIDPAHLGWQAAHEATVLEVADVADPGSGLGEREVEGVALCVLAARSQAAGVIPGYRSWSARWGVTPEHCDPGRLSPTLRAAYERLM